MATFIGFAFPFQKGPTGFPASAVDNNVIQQDLIQLVLTGTGERVMRPDVGSNAFSFVFQNTGAPLQSLIQQEVRQVVSKYEPRVVLLGVDVVINDSSKMHPSLITITLNYIVVATRQAQSVNITIGGP